MAAAVDVAAPAVAVTAGIVCVATHAICGGVVAPVVVVVVHAGRRRVALKTNIIFNCFWNFLLHLRMGCTVEKVGP